MKTKFHLPEVLVFIIAALPFAYLAYIYPKLPETVATHFGADGKPNAFGDKSSLWTIISITGVISLLTYFLMRFLPKIDPKRSAKYSASTFNKIGVALVLFLCLLNCFIINASQQQAFKFANVIPVLIGIFFAFMGNLMPSLKPNYFAGIRTPWTLESEDTWRKTHQLAGKLWFAGGILIVALSLFLPIEIAMYSLFIVTMVIVIIPIIFSYKYFKSIQNKTN
jgi:uncharacterized membrane protein